jgi:hypothetical protein
MARLVPSQVVATIDQLPLNMVPVTNSRRYSIGEIHALQGVIELVEQIPKELLTMSPSTYSDFVVCLAMIRAQTEHWRVRGETSYVMDLKGQHPVAVVRGGLLQCPDEVPSPLTASLGFIPDSDLRDSIRSDISATNQALVGGEWKAATVLAGSAIEALLLWGVQQPPAPTAMVTAIATLIQSGALARKPPANPVEWTLHQFIEVAAELRLIKPDTQTAARLAKDFRNLIHPGRVARLGQVCDRATALSAVAALEHVVRDLTP